MSNAKNLKSRAKASILINYNNNKYKLLNLKTKPEYWSRDVITFEGVFISNLKQLFINIFDKEIKTLI